MKANNSIHKGDQRAVFLDRDGTINAEVNYLSGSGQLKLLPEAARAIRLVNPHGFLVIVVSNQSGIGRGYLTVEEVERVHREMRFRLAEENAFVNAIYYCPHCPDANCDCRKPKIGMIQKAAMDFGIDLGGSYVIGDKLTDAEMGPRAGCRTILVLTGYGREENQKARTKGVRPDFVAPDLGAAVDWILYSEAAIPS